VLKVELQQSMRGFAAFVGVQHHLAIHWCMHSGILLVASMPKMIVWKV
jgi:hypothetical protein